MTLLPMENGEGILCALKCFEQEKPLSIPSILEDYIKQISRNGQTRLPWIYVKPLLLHKYNKVVDSFISEGSGLDYSMLATPPHLSELRQRVFNTLKRLDGIPFTIQRICELFDSPTRHYQRVDKFLRGLEKVCMVVSTVDPYGNKIHQEDPRFPSRAGLDDCGLLIEGSITSPPTSPPPENPQVHHISKSSDEEVTEEDDEGEDNSSDGSDERQSPKADHSMNPNPLMNNSCASSWLFKAQNSLNLPHTPPMPFRSSVSKTRLADQSLTSAPLLSGLCGSLLSAYSNNDEDYDQLNRSSENKHTDSNTQVNSDHLSSVGSSFCSESSECLHALPVESNLQEKPSDASHKLSSVVQDEIQDNSLPWNEATKMPIVNSETLEDTIAQCDKPDEVSSSGIKPSVSNVNRNDSPSRRLELDTTGDESDLAGCQVLRPIGQLEAFVQNLNSEVSSSVTSVPLHSGSPKSTSDPSAHLSCVSSMEDLNHQGSITSSNSLLPVLVGVRRPRSPGMDSSGSDPNVSTSKDADLSESPAKRRRLPSSDLTETVESSTDSLVGISFQIVTSSSLALNDSPPIIMCNPTNQTRDMDSGECIFEASENPSSGQSVVDPISASDNISNLHEVVNISFAQNSESSSESVEGSETVLINNDNIGLSTVNLSNINSETGEEES
ncbi:protein phosphatase 4, regulatory subunit 2 [Schistosoma haematobium]|uniref:Protein phosphatase 4, regulatory subunit 2 n=1 Tax=Schistosoma haematobium TaxID=6185 RepID=A0A922LVV3_SCHHA|nr:protein phosphatase 4, regulatory subunit 2 [Schistosoma haematobium]KAH9594821.1 protein phosphatase 4, regulatory subunit 2 [Schistosoma haematobium]